MAKTKRAGVEEEPEVAEKPKKKKRAKEEAEETLEEPLAEPEVKRKKKKAVDAEEIDEQEEEQPKKKKKKRAKSDQGLEKEEEPEPIKKNKEQTDADGITVNAKCLDGKCEAPKQKEKKVATGKEAVADDDASFGESTTVFISGIPWAVDEENLRKDFEECGEVTDVNLLKDRETGLARGIAFMTFATEAGMRAALKYDGEDYGSRKLAVRRAEAPKAKGKGKGKGKEGKSEQDRTFEVFVKGFPAETMEEDVKKEFSECGEISSVNMPMRGSGLSKGFAWLVFTSDEAVLKATSLHGKEFGKSTLTVEKSGLHTADADGNGTGKGKGKGKMKGKAKGKSSDCEVFVSNLTYETEEKELRKDFLECGEIDRVHMPTKGGKCMGFAWITFRTKEALEKALAFNGDDYGGRRLKVEKSGQHGGQKLKQVWVDPDAGGAE